MRSRGRSVPSDAVVCEWRSTALSLLSAGQIREDRAHGDARGALGAERRVLVDERRSRDVEVGPRNAPGELLEEEPGGDGPAVAPAGIVQVGDVALELLLVLLDERQLPHALARGARGSEQTVGEALVRRHQPR